MKPIVILLMCLSSLVLFGQTFTENDLKKFAEETNKQIKGVEIGNGVKVIGCFSLGRTIVYQYDVPASWNPPNNLKEDIISNFKNSGHAKAFFLSDIGVDFYYYVGNKLKKKVSVKSKEFSSFSSSLDEYISIKDHPKSKEVNLKIKVPVGWEVKEGDRPNIVKKFTKEGNTFIILIKDNITFFSRKQIREALQEDDFVKDFIHQFSSNMENSQVEEQSVVTIDTYPSIKFKVRGKTERLGLTLPMIMKGWIVFYEDKMILIGGTILDEPEQHLVELLYDLLANSVIFPEQYN